MSNYLLSLHVNFAARKSSLKNVSESGQPHCAEWVWPVAPLYSKQLTIHLLYSRDVVQLYVASLENLSNIFKIPGDYKKLLNMILKTLETQSELIHMLTCYKLQLI